MVAACQHTSACPRKVRYVLTTLQAAACASTLYADCTFLTELIFQPSPLCSQALVTCNSMACTVTVCGVMRWYQQSSADEEVAGESLLEMHEILEPPPPLRPPKRGAAEGRRVLVYPAVAESEASWLRPAASKWRYDPTTGLFFSSTEKITSVEFLPALRSAQIDF